jgi:hypothetical protein
MTDQRDGIHDYQAQQLRFDRTLLCAQRGGLGPFQRSEGGSKLLENGGDSGIS